MCYLGVKLFIIYWWQLILTADADEEVDDGEIECDQVCIVGGGLGPTVCCRLGGDGHHQHQIQQSSHHTYEDEEHFEQEMEPIQVPTSSHPSYSFVPTQLTHLCPFPEVKWGGGVSENSTGINIIHFKKDDPQILL